MSNDMKLEEYLKKLRKSHNYSQEFVASHLNISRQTYSHYETGRITPPVNSLYNLAKLYGISVEELVKLVVTYHIEDDFAGREKCSVEKADTKAYFEYNDILEDVKKEKSLSYNERVFLYYYNQLENRDREDILDFMKVKHLRRKEEERSGKERDRLQVK